ncbi:MAG: PEP-CTERM sorting domain-containing protein [Verrucomicrobiota bacterium]
MNPFRSTSCLVGVLLAVSSLIGQSAVVFSFGNGGDGPSGSDTSITFNATGGITVNGTTEVGNDPTGDLSQPGDFGTIVVTYTSIADDDAGTDFNGPDTDFDPATFLGGDVTNDFVTNSAGLGISDGTDNAGLQVGEAVLVQFDLSAYTGPGLLLVSFLEDANDGRTLDLHYNDAPGSGVFVGGGTNDAADIVNFQLSDGDLFAFVNPNTNASRLTQFTLDVIPEPSSGLLLGFGVLLLSGFRRRRTAG